MDIYGIGTDIVSCERVANMWLRYGMHFAQRILTHYEYAAFEHLSENLRVNFLAKRFAAKEAISKALGVGFTHYLMLREVGVETDYNGKPLAVCYGRSLKYLNSLGKITLHLSLADEKEYAQAFVIAVKNN